MSTETELVQDALKEIGAFSVFQVVNPQSIEDGRKKLHGMLQLWFSDGIDLGVICPAKAAGDDICEPLDARNAIVFNLALLCASLFDNGKVVVSETLKANAWSEYSKVKDLYEKVTIPNKVVSSTLPVGAGNRREFDTRTYFGEGAEIKN